MAVLLLAQGADEVEVAHLAAPLVLGVGEEQPPVLQRVVAPPVVRDLHLGAGLRGFGREFVSDEVDLVLEVDVQLVREVGRRDVEDIGLEPLLVLGAEALAAADAGEQEAAYGQNR